MDLRSKTARGPVLRALQEEMARTHSLITLRRAQELGASKALVGALVAEGEWIRLHEGVFRHRAAPVTDMQRLAAALLAGGEGACASHRSAAWVWHLLASPPPEPEIIVDGKHRLVGVRAHRTTAPERPVLRGGVLVTPPARTVLDVVGVVRPETAELIVDRAVATKLVSIDGLVEVLRRSGRRGRRGTAALRSALEARGVSCPSRPPSVLESAMARLCRAFGLPVPVAEHVPFPGAPYRFDFAWPEVKVAVEVDGYEAHSSYDAFRRGLARDRWCVEHGWLVLHFSWHDVRSQPEMVAAQILRVLASRHVA